MASNLKIKYRIKLMIALDDDEKILDCVVWSSDATTFEIKNKKLFEYRILPFVLGDKFDEKWKSGKYLNFSAALKTWGFRLNHNKMVRKYRWYHPLFARNAFTSKKKLLVGNGNGNGSDSDSDSNNQNTAEYSKVVSDRRKREVVEKIIEFRYQKTPFKKTGRDLLAKFYLEVSIDNLFLITRALSVSPNNLSSLVN